MGEGLKELAEWNRDIGVGSHIPWLAKAISKTTGPIIECGMGDYSSVMCHVMAGNRELVSLETDLTWMRKYAFLESPTHKLRHVADWGREIESLGHIGLAFVDNSPGEERVRVIAGLKGKCDIILAHDTEADIPPSGGNYGWRYLECLFKQQVIFKLVRPWTTLYTDLENFRLD